MALSLCRFIFAAVFVVTFCLGSFCALPAKASPLSSIEEGEARRSVARMNQDDRTLSLWLPKFEQAWTSVCFPRVDRSHCFVTECEVSPESCRPERILLFRGEPSKFPTPGTSGLLRSRWAGSDYHVDALSGESLLSALRSDLVSIRPIIRGGFSNEDGDLVLQRHSGAWAHVESGSVSAGSFQQILFGSHSSGSYLAYDDEHLGRVSLDPLISFSPNPYVAHSFSGGAQQGSSPGRLIVLSIPRSEIAQGCGETIPKSGSVQDSGDCGSQMHSDEIEFDSVLYVSPDYVWKSF